VKKSKRKPVWARVPLFDDTFEVEHVVYLLRSYAECPQRRLTREQLDAVRANSVLPVLEERLRASLTETGIPESALHDLPRPLTNLQHAYVDALRSVRGAPYPGDWSRTALAELESLLLTIHAIVGDSARHKLVSTEARRLPGRSRGGDTTKILQQDEASQRTKAQQDEIRQILKDDPLITKEEVEEDLVRKHNITTDRGRKRLKHAIAAVFVERLANLNQGALRPPA
jgi:hypothetical protein